MQGYKDWRWSVTDLLQSDFNRNAGGSHEHWLGCVFWGADSLKEIFLEDILHVCDGSMPPVSINPNRSLDTPSPFLIGKVRLSGILPASVRILILATPRRSPLRLRLGEKHAA